LLKLPSTPASFGSQAAMGVFTPLGPIAVRPHFSMSLPLSGSLILHINNNDKAR